MKSIISKLNDLKTEAKALLKEAVEMEKEAQAHKKRFLADLDKIRFVPATQRTLLYVTVLSEIRKKYPEIIDDAEEEIISLITTSKPASRGRKKVIKKSKGNVEWEVDDLEKLIKQFQGNKYIISM